MERSTLDIMWLLTSAGLVFLMQAGFTALESGLTRSKNSINVAMKNLIDISISIVMFWLFGFALMFGTSSGGWIGIDGFFGTMPNSSWLIAFFLFQALFCGTATTIVSGAVAERMTFRGYAILSLLISGLLYPVFGHWAWNGLSSGVSTGWLQRLGFIDFAGATVVHSIGGWVGLAAIIVIGPRIGRFSKNAPAQKIQGSNLPLAALGVFFLWLGWFGFNGGSTLAAVEEVPLIILNTILAAASGGVMPLIISWRRPNHVEVEPLMNGVLAGLVAITASANMVSSLSAVVIGFIASLVMMGMTALLERLKIDDAIGAVPVHLGGGVWGTLAVALFASSEFFAPGVSRVSQLGVQAFGIFVSGLWAFGAGYIVIKLISRVLDLRIPPDDEQRGLNIAEHGATTEVLDLLQTMQTHAVTGNIENRVQVEPFTEIGQIAQQYNRVMDALQASVTRTEAIVRSIQSAIITFSEDGKLLSLNPSTEKMFGYPLVELIGQPVSQMFRFETNLSLETSGRDAQDRPKTIFELSIGQPYRVLGKHKNGDVFPLEVVTEVFDTDQSKVYTGIFRDISQEEAEREERQRLMLRRANQVAVSTEVAQSITTAENLEDLYATLISLAQEKFGYYYLHLYILEQDQLIVREGSGQVGQQLKSEAHTVSLEARPSLVAKAARDKSPVLVSNVDQMPDWLPNPLLPDTKSELAVPIIFQENLLGVIDIQDDQTYGLDEEDQTLVVGLAGLLAAAIENTRLRIDLEANIQELSVFYRQESDKGWDAIRNELEAKTYQFTNGNLQQASVESIWSEQLKQVAQSENIVVTDTDEGQVSAITTPLKVSSSTLIGVLGVPNNDSPLTIEEQQLIQSVSEQVSLALESARQFEQTRLALSETQILQKFGQELNVILDRREILNVFYRFCTEELGFEYVQYSLVNVATNRVEARGGVGITEDQIRRSNHLLSSRDIMADIIRTGATEVITGWDDRFDKDNFDAEGHSGWIRVFTPIVLRSENIGLVEAGFKKGGSEQLIESRVSLLKSLINQNTIAMDNAERYEIRQKALRREQAIREITEKMQTAATVEQLVEMTTEALGSQFSADLAMVELGRREGDAQSLPQKEASNQQEGHTTPKP
ncbi:MAG: ammonium transporter [Chloroflexota bacterium]